MTEYEITFNYQKAMNQAAELKAIASSLKKVGETQLAECLGKISKNWLGSNSEDFVAKGKKMETKIEKSSKSITLTAGAIETMAKNIYNAEMEALRIARERENK